MVDERTWNEWFPWSKKRRNAPVTLVCFANAGGGATLYSPWRLWLPEAIDLQPVVLPGRENRIKDPPLDSIEEIAARVAPAVVGLCEAVSGRHLAFFGHSMGAIVAFEVIRKLLLSGAQPLPVLLIASAMRAPQLMPLGTQFHCLPEHELFSRLVARFGGIPQQVLQNPDFLRLLYPAVKADLKALETYRFTPGPKLPIPIAAFGGQNDAEVPYEHLQGWAEQTSSWFDVRLFLGGHFYLRQQPKQVLQAIVELLAKVGISLQA